MVDLHTHILPGMDDGAATVEESIEMLRLEAAQGVDTVVLTTHFYREKESPARFARRREKALKCLQEAIQQLPEQEQAALPRLIPAAEVAWRADLERWEDIDLLCFGPGRNLMLELPISYWGERVFASVYELANEGITPVLAHMDRYFYRQEPDAIQSLLRSGFPVQISTSAILRPVFGRKFVRMMERELNVVLASDCHDLGKRKPDMGPAVARLTKKLGEETVETILQRGRVLVGD